MTDNDEVPPLMRESFVLHNRDSILDRLQLMARRRTLLTAVPVGTSIGTSVNVKRILPERGLIAVETGAGPDDTKPLLQAKQVVFSGRVDGIAVKFEVGMVREATLDGYNLLAAPIPDALLWLQRRQYFRAFIPHDMPIKCQISLPNEEYHWFDVINLSVRGIALLDKSGRLRFWGRTGQVFEHCRLDLPNFETERFDLQIRSKLETSAEATRAPTLRVGFSFLEIHPRLEAKIQRLLNELEIKARTERFHLDFPGR